MRGSNVRGDYLVAYSRVGKDGRITIPAAIRRKLRVRAGAELTFTEVAGGAVLLRRRERLDFSFLRGLEATLSEWNSAEDDRAFRDL
jgi:antitoxin PrlF